MPSEADRTTATGNMHNHVFRSTVKMHKGIITTGLHARLWPY